MKTKKTKRVQSHKVRLRSAIHLTRLNVIVGAITVFFLFIGFAAMFAGGTSNTAATTPAYLQKYEHPNKTNNGSKATSKSTSAKPSSASSKSSSDSSSYSSYGGKSQGTATHYGYNTTVMAANKPAKALIISPSSITIYKNSNGAKGVKEGVTSTVIDVSSSDSQLINEPSVTSGSGLTAVGDGDNASRASWALETSAGSASLGGYTMTFTSSSPSGTVYTGSLHVEVAAVPAFSLATSNINAIVRIGTTNTATFTGLSYDAGTSGSAAPNITATNIVGGNIICSSGLSYNASNVVCTDPNISRESSSTTTPMAFTFQNQYQLITVGGNLIFTNSSSF